MIHNDHVTVIDRTIEFLRTGKGDELDLINGLVVVREILSQKTKRLPVLYGTLIKSHYHGDNSEVRTQYPC